jgi:hypothetical protein
MTIQHTVDQSNGGKLALAEAEKLRGRPYVFGGWPLGNSGTDCSGTWDWAYAQIGVNIGRTTFVQYQEHQIKKGSKLEPGDLLFILGSDSQNGKPGHVMGFVKDGQVFQAPFTGETINFYPYNTSDYLYVTRPALALPIHVPAPSKLILSSNHLVVISEQETGTAVKNGYAVRNWNGSSFPLDDPTAGPTRVLYTNSDWKKKHVTPPTPKA